MAVRVLGSMIAESDRLLRSVADRFALLERRMM